MYSSTEQCTEFGDINNNSVRSGVVISQEREIFLRAILQLLDERDAQIDAGRYNRRSTDTTTKSDVIKSGNDDIIYISYLISIPRILGPLYFNAW